MWSKFARNSVLLGPLDAYCLVCETHLRDEETASLHISKAAHLQTLDSIGYFEKYKNEFVRKTRSGYFCEVCNALVPTAAQAGLHVAEPRHAERRDRRRLRRVAGRVLARGRLLAEDAWHGLVDDTCVLCNADYDDKRAHRADRAHVLKVLQSKLLFGDDDSAYRKIDDSSYQCLICNTVFSANYFSEHFKHEEHTDAHKRCEITHVANNTMKDPVPTSQKKSETVQDTEERSLLGDDIICKVENVGIIDSILASVEIFQKNGVKIDFVNECAYCKKCLKEIPFDGKALKKHVDEHKEHNIQFTTSEKEHTPVPFESGADSNTKPPHRTKPVSTKIDVKETVHSTASSSSEEIASLIKEHGLEYKGQKLYCNTCGIRIIGVSIQNIKSHVNGEAHKNAAKQNIKKKVSVKILFENVTFVKSANKIELIFDEKLCIDFFSFQFIGERHYSGAVGCLACNVSLPPELVESHISSPSHIRLLEQILVVSSLKTEFVREIKPGLFHCGFCNDVEEDWVAMKYHLATSEHKNAKVSAEWRLQEHLTNIRTDDGRQRVENSQTMRTIANLINNTFLRL